MNVEGNLLEFVETVLKGIAMADGFERVVIEIAEEHAHIFPGFHRDTRLKKYVRFYKHKQKTPQ